ncbi:membrane protein [Sulfodiicoccus acidiphilus]|nr:membrane protein [Sulfodiicoccus acidiphilus]
MAILMAFISFNYFLLLFKYTSFSLIESVVAASLASFVSLVTSPVNVVIKEVRRRVELPTVDTVYVFGIPIYFPRLELSTLNTLIAVNVGGALIPVLLSAILVQVFRSSFLFLLLDVLLVTVLSKYMARVVQGVGIVMSPILPPLISTLLAFLTFHSDPFLIPAASYISGVLGTLIGADLLNLKKVVEASPQIVSIGGMGTFDGIYITGILAILFSYILISLQL